MGRTPSDSLPLGSLTILRVSKWPLQESQALQTISQVLRQQFQPLLGRQHFLRAGGLLKPIVRAQRLCPTVPHTEGKFQAELNAMGYPIDTDVNVPSILFLLFSIGSQGDISSEITHVIQSISSLSRSEYILLLFSSTFQWLNLALASGPEEK